MDFKVLSGKTILIISPQSWDYIKVSKHHYAIELSKRNKVYFLNPNSTKVPRGTCKLSGKTVEGVNVLDYRPLFPMRYKFKYNRLFNYFIKWDIRNILKVIGSPPDIVWDFEPNRQFADLKLFGSKINIYHPVDITANINQAVKNADILFSVSSVILDLFKDAKIPTYFINHGLNELFAKRARNHSFESQIKSGVDIGYIGNLRMDFIDHESFMNVIKNNPNVNFHIYGPYEENLLIQEARRPVINSFIKFLQESKNVKLYGVRTPGEIVNEINFLDGFFWCFDNVRDPNKGSNSHKILEYLSTGKVVISTYIETYKEINKLDWIVTPQDNEIFETCFSRVISNIEYYNNKDLALKRIELALASTYESHLMTIDKLILSLRKN